MDRKERILEIYVYNKKRLINLNEIFDEGRATIGSLNGFESSRIRYSHFKFAKEGTTSHMRQLYYLAAKAYILKSRWRIMERGMFRDPFLYAILSENKEIIEEFKKPYLLSQSHNYEWSPVLSGKKRIEDFPKHPDLEVSHHFKRCFLAILLNNYDALLESVDYIDWYAKENPKRGKYLHLYTDYYRAMLDKNEEKLNKVIKNLYKKRKPLQAVGYIPEYSLVTTGMAKLAIYKGMEVTIDKSDVPKDLLKTAPLDHYESYEWLDLWYDKGYKAYIEKYVPKEQRKGRLGLLDDYVEDVPTNRVMDIREHPLFKDIHQSFAYDLGLASPY